MAALCRIQEIDIITKHIVIFLNILKKKKFDKPQISLNEDKTLTKTTDYGAWYNAYR